MFYAHNALDRADHLRREPETLAALIANKNTQLTPVWRGRSLVGDLDGQSHMLMLPITSIDAASNEAYQFLGLQNDTGVFSVSFSALEEAELEPILAQAQKTHDTFDNIRFEDLRVVGPRLSASDGAILAYARGLCHWHDNCHFCTRCGGKLKSTQGGHVKQCETSSCDYQSFPRTDPAVIMLVLRPATDNTPEQCLLGRNPAWPEGVFSTLAGFVETGESLEQAVQREVFEESGIKTHKVEYVASQPWPFPRSIMLGFQAEALSTDINLDPVEIEDARWFTREELNHFGTWGVEGAQLKLPRSDSIARLLIDRWMNSAN